MDFDEGSLRFSFDSSWQVVKYDDTPLYRDGVGVIPFTKAVDFIGLRKGTLFLVEVKDFREHRIENERRLTEGELAVEIAQKIRDSIAGLVGAHRTAANPEAVAPFVRVFVKADSEIKVVIWLEHDLPEYPSKREKVKMSVEGNAFKKKLRWLTPKVFVANVNHNVLQEAGMTVRNLPHVSQG